MITASLGTVQHSPTYSLTWYSPPALPYLQPPLGTVQRWTRPPCDGSQGDERLTLDTQFTHSPSLLIYIYYSLQSNFQKGYHVIQEDVSNSGQTYCSK